MPKTMLIDAGHREETRVAVIQGGKVEDFDFEYASRKPLRGNIYLARVTRVEPSLQAAFIEYGGNRHGFLAFGEIHPDYYQIPVADREVLRKAEALEVELAQKLAELNQDDDDTDAIDPDEDELGGRGSDDRGREEAEAAAEAAGEEESDDEAPADYAPGSEAEDGGDWHAADEGLIEAVGASEETTDDDSDDELKKRDASPEEEEEEEEKRDDEDLSHSSAAMEAEAGQAVRSTEDEAASTDDAGDDGDHHPAEASTDDAPRSETTATDDEGATSTEDETGDAESRADEQPENKKPEPTEEELAARARQKEINQLRSRYEEAKRERNRLLRAYKIQEVIKRRQIMLVQVVKEERGNKGAALTTYLSLAGRYGVLMPNTARGGGISRKITSQSDRKRLKKAMAGLDIPQNMGLIIRTAGAKRTKTEIKRDYDYLSRLWETIREKTLESVAPALIYEEASLMKRAIRDLYDKDTETIHVQGDDGYREAKDFMKMLMPSHAKNVKQHKSPVPIFLKHGVEEQLDGMYQPVVQLRSGGYIVIQQTEALVSIDVNSGKATKERNVEQTALKTNSEAAIEVARQCRLRDLAGLIVIDFIDMEENRNNRAVEKKLKDAMKNDRARTQIGSISSFGLLEMSRQRRRSGIVDGTTQACPVCEGAGAVRSHEMAALRILRAAEGQAATGKHGLITVKTSTEVALYVLNTKREWLQRMEATYGVKTNIIADSGRFGDQYEVQGSGSPSEAISLKDTIGDDGPLSDLDAPELPNVESRSDDNDNDNDEQADSDDKPRKRRRRRRRRGGGDDRQDESDTSVRDTGQDRDTSQDDDDSSDDNESDGDTSGSKSENNDDNDGDGEPKRKRRRGRRGGRRNRRKSDSAEGGTNDDQSQTDKNDGKDDEDKAAAKDTSGENDKSNDSTDTGSSDNVVSLDEKRNEPAEVKTEAPSGDRSSDEASSPGAEAETDEPEAEPQAAAEAPSQPEPHPQPQLETEKPKGPRKSGWWQRAFQKD